MINWPPHPILKMTGSRTYKFQYFFQYGVGQFHHHSFLSGRIRENRFAGRVKGHSIRSWRDLGSGIQVVDRVERTSAHCGLSGSEQRRFQFWLKSVNISRFLVRLTCTIIATFEYSSFSYSRDFFFHPVASQSYIFIFD